jgi:serine/threonine-protein kinase HipA
MTIAAVTLWGSRIAAVSIEAGARYATFQYDPAFVRSGIEIAPVRIGLRAQPYSFPGLPRDAFSGLPGLLADSLPDRWGTALVNAWLASQGREPSSFDVVQRLCYVGTRGVGALEFQPAHEPSAPADAEDLQVAALVRLASEVLAQREEFVAELSENPDEEAMKAILAVGSSAGGARPKAFIAYNDATGQVRSGQVEVGEGFRHWLLKFDGVKRAGDHGLADPQGWGAVEYAYSKMARAAGIEMTECRLLEEHGRRHFMTRRFDRPGGGKLHMQTAGALEHVSYNEPGTYSYEQLMLLIRRLGLGKPVVEQQFRRMVFNVVARNQDDHVKNVAFLMDREGAWSLAPAYDVIWAWEPGNLWLGSHQMSLNGKRDGFSAADLDAVAGVAGLPRGRAKGILAEVSDVVAGWQAIAEEVEVDGQMAEQIARSHRLKLPAS